ncbi:MAG: 50S ribosomal protein L11 methyltransferase [Desulfobacterales bacterium]
MIYISALLDIGTGSGILAIAALQLGITRAVGIDTDPCARAEANRKRRSERSRVTLYDHGSTPIAVTARREIYDIRHWCDRAEPSSHIWQRPVLLVLSGIKSDEQAFVMAVYHDKGWVGLVLRRSPC